MYSQFLAKVGDIPLPEELAATGPKGVFRDVVLLVGISVALLIVLMVGTKFYWTRRRHRSSHRPRPSTSSTASAKSSTLEEGEDAEPAHRSRHRKRRRRREHRARNATLAETGGLPPKRPAGELPPSL